jgi:hypothetical protein
VKISSLECLGSSCKRIAFTLTLVTEATLEIFPEITNKMPTAHVEGIWADWPDPIHLAAAKALGKSLSFTRKNTENRVKRDYWN